jgi:hypothetical protein
MRNFHQIAGGVDVMPLTHALRRNEQLWNAHAFRTTFTNTPHSEVDDIWLRYAEVREGDTNDEIANTESCVWHSAIHALPQAKPIILSLMHRLEAYELCRALITRLAPGGHIYPHADVGGAYVHMKDIGRYHVVLQGLPGCNFRCGEEIVQMQTGEIWWFNAHLEHEVVNNSEDDRIHLLVDVRTMP